MTTREEALKYGLSFPDTYQDAPFHDPNWQLVRYGGTKKAFLWTYERNGYVNLNVKVDPEKAFFWREIYKAVIPGYHQNKDHWNTIVLDGSIPDEDVKMMIAESYDLISDSPSKRIYEAVKKIPYGRVATYSQIAEAAGDKKMARAVGNALHRNPDPDGIPCFRVVNAKGELAGEFAFGGSGAQAKLLEAEGVEVTDGKVDLERFQWKPGKESVKHPFPPFYDADSQILILGSFPSVKSREQMFFYGHPQNRFWKVIAAVFEDAAPSLISDKKSFLAKHHIALWDVIASCDIKGSSDASIENVVPNDLSVILRTANIRGIFVNGKTAEKYYRKYIESKTGVKAVCLPSTSPANAAWSEEDLVGCWKEQLGNALQTTQTKVSE